MSSSNLGAGVACVIASFACASTQIKAPMNESPRVKAGTATPPDKDALGQELLQMCDFCYSEAKAGDYSRDRCNKGYPDLIEALTGCSYPPCPAQESRTPSYQYSDPEKEEKLACAACRALCPFSAGTPTQRSDEKQPPAPLKQ